VRPLTRRRGAGLLCVLVLLGAGAGLYSAAAAAGPLRLSGRVGTVYPGVTRPMKVIAHNRLGQPVRLGVVRARVLRGGPGCGPWNLVVRRRRLKLAIGPHGRRPLKLRVGLRASAPDACQGVRFRLRLRGSGRRLGSSLGTPAAQRVSRSDGGEAIPAVALALFGLLGGWAIRRRSMEGSDQWPGAG
jgi:hypothetical protein